MTTRTEPHTGPAGPSRIEATVLGSLPNAMFRLQLTDGREVTAHAALDLRKVFTRLLPGDRVLIELSPFDPGRSRICSLVKAPLQHSNPQNLHPRES